VTLKVLNSGFLLINRWKETGNLQSLAAECKNQYALDYLWWINFHRCCLLSCFCGSQWCIVLIARFQ